MAKEQSSTYKEQKVGQLSMEAQIAALIKERDEALAREAKTQESLDYALHLKADLQDKALAATHAAHLPLPLGHGCNPMRYQQELYENRPTAVLAR